MRAVYIISKIITLPGAYIKAFWENLFCRALGVPVESADLLRYDETLGHVEQEFARTKLKSFLVCWLPGLANKILGAIMFTGGALGLLYLGVGPKNAETGEASYIFYVYILLFYLGVSLLCNIFPLIENALHMWEMLYGGEGVHIVWKVVLFIPAVIIVAGAYIERYALSLLLYIALIAVSLFV